MKLRLIALVLPVAIGFACDRPVAPPPTTTAYTGPISAQSRKGTGLILNSLTGVTLPLIGSLGDVTIDQAELTNFALIENGVGQIVGVQVDGVLQLTGGVLGSQLVSEDFSTAVQVASSGPGQCGVATLDLAPFDINPLGLGLVNVDLPAASVDAKGSGAVGPLLCALGQVTNPITAAVRGIVQALNRLI